MALEAQHQQPQPLQQYLVSGGDEPHHHRGIAAGAIFRQPIPITLDLFHPSNHPEIPCPLPLDFQQKLLSLKRSKMSHRAGQKLDLKLNLSPPRAGPRAESPSRSASVSPPSSCVSSEINQDGSSSPEVETTSMMLVGCPRCLMYVMLAEADPRCPKCKSTVLLDVVAANKTRN